LTVFREKIILKKKEKEHFDMIYSSKDMESRAVLDTAAKICAAARTAPKTRGMDGLVTCVLTGEDKSQLATQMRKLADGLDYAFFNRDADNVDASDAVVLFGMEEVRRGLDAGCQYCHFESCADCTEKDGLCAWDAIDIGIAIGSAIFAVEIQPKFGSTGFQPLIELFIGYIRTDLGVIRTLTGYIPCRFLLRQSQ